MSVDRLSHKKNVDLPFATPLYKKSSVSIEKDVLL